MAWMARSIALVVTLLLGACVAPPPTGPTVAALASKGKDPAQFQQDDLSCRQLAFDGIAPEEQYSAMAQQQRYDLGYVQCMTARGNIAPVMAAGAAPYGYPYYPTGYGYPYAYPYPYPYAYPYAYPYGYPWYWGAPVGGVGASFFFGSGHGHGHHGHSHGHGSAPHH
jgi:hypothetical protein